MDVMTAARDLGLTGDAGGGFGTIEEPSVIEALLDLGKGHPGHGDLFADAVAKVQRSRSAGQLHIDADSVFAKNRTERDVQLRYRAEMAELFLDLAIDLGSLEQAQAPTATVETADASS